MAEGETILAKTNADFSLFGAISIESNINAAIPGLIRYNASKDIFEGYVSNGRAYLNNDKFVPMSLDVASSSNLGGIKIGNNLAITSTGILNSVAESVSRKFQRILIVSASLQADESTTGDYRSINQCLEQFFGYNSVLDTFPDGELASLDKDEYPDPSENNNYIILLTPGEYKEDLTLVDITKHQTLDLPPYVNLVGDDRDSCIINIKNLTSILMRSNTSLKNVTINLTNANTNLTPSSSDEIIKGINILTSASNIIIDNVKFMVDTVNFNTSFIYTNTNTNVNITNILMKTDTILEGVNSEIASNLLEFNIFDINQSSVNLNNIDIYIESNKHKKSIIYANDLSIVYLNNSKLEIKEVNLSSSVAIQNQVIYLIDSVFTCNYSSIKCHGYDNNYTNTTIRNQGIRLDSLQNYNLNQSNQAVFIHNESRSSHDIIKVPISTLDFSQFYVNGNKIKISGTSNNNNIIGTSYINTGTITEFGSNTSASIMGVDLSTSLNDEELNGITTTFKELYQINIFTSQITSDSETIYFDESDSNKNDNYYIQCSQTQINGVNSNIGNNRLIFNNNNEIFVGKEEGNYNSISDALSSITDATSINKYSIYIKPGTYVESKQLLIPEYVSLIGDNTIIKFDSNADQFSENVCLMLSSNCVIQNIEFLLDKVQNVTKNNIAVSTSNYLSTMEANLTDDTYFDDLNQLTNITLQNIKFTLTDDFVNLNKLRCCIFCKVSNMNVNNTKIIMNNNYTNVTELDVKLIYNKLTNIIYNNLTIENTGNINNFDYNAIINDGCTNTYYNSDILINITPSSSSTLKILETSDLLESNINKTTLSTYNTFIISGSIRAISDVNITSLYSLFADYNSTLVATNVILEGNTASRNNSNNDYPNSLLKTMGCFQIASNGSLISNITEIDTRGNSAIANNSLHVGDPIGSLDNIPSYNVLVGIRVATLNSLGVRNTMIGVDVGKNQTSGNDNVYLGSNVAIQALENENVFIGSNTASSLKIGSQNVIIGKNSANTSNIINRSIIIGNDNAKLVNNLNEAVIIGSSSMNVSNSSNLSNLMVIGSNNVGNSLSEAHKNIILGNYTMTNAQTSNENITIGHNSASVLTNATKNIIIGNDTCSSITTANNTVVIGTNNLSRVGSTTTTNNNLIIGNRAMLNTTTASDSIILGTGAGRNITTGSRNIIMGQEKYTVGNSTSTAKSLTTGNDNIILGSNAAISSTSGNRNFIIGNNSGNSLNTTNDTIILGYNSGGNISGGTSQDSQNIIIGNETGKLASSGKVIMIGHESGQKSTGVDSLIIGNRAGRTIAGPRNTIIGNKAAGVSNDEANPVLGQDNILIGTYSGFQLTTGNYNVILGSGDGSNTAGPGTLDTAGSGYSLKSGDRNFIGGFNAGRKLVSGSDNILMGSQAGAYMSQSNRNVLIGKNAGLKLGSNDTLEANSDNNVIIGYEAGENITLGNDLLFIGRSAGKNATSGQDNTYLGNYAGENNSGNRNTFIGSRSGNLNEGENNTIIGTNAGRYSQTSSFNTLIGYETGRGVSSLIKNNGDFNTMIGYQAGQENTEGYRNLYMGYLAGQKNRTGNKNIFMGPNAGLNSNVSKSIFIGAAESNTGGVGINTTGTLNVLIGPETGVAVTSGSKNVMLGSYTGQKLTTASSTVLIGADAGQNLTTGDKNVLVGPGTGNQITTGTNNIMLGDRAGNEATTTASENILIGTLAGSKTEINNSINIGNKSGQNNETGIGNILIGRYAGQKFEQSRNNIMIGSNTGLNFYPTGSNITQGENIYIGSEVGKNNITGTKNICIGSNSFSSSSYGNSIIAIGYNAAKNACTTSNQNITNNLFENTIIGYEAGSQGDYNIRNVMVGSQTGRNIDNPRKFQGNVLLGAQTGKNSNLSINSVILGSANKIGQGGINNVIAGTNAGDLLGSRDFKKFTTLTALGQTFFNVVVLNENLSIVSKYIRHGDTILLDDGNNTFESTISSLSNYSILFDNLIESNIDVNISVSSNNVAVLYLADNYINTTEIAVGASIFLLSNISNNIGDTDISKSSANSLLGFNAGKSLTTGSKNVVLGSDALQANQIGKYNNILGTQAGYNTITDNNTFLGTKAGYSVDSQTKDTLENYIYNIQNNEITIYFQNAIAENLNYTGNTLIFNYGDIIDITNTTYNNGRYKVENSTLTANSSFTSSLVIDEMTIKVQGFPRYEQIGVPDNIGINDIKVNASTYIYDKFTSPVNRNSQFVSVLYNGTSNIINANQFINSNKYYNGSTEITINNEVVGFYPIVNVSNSRFNDGYYYCRPDYTSSNYNIFSSYNKLYSEYMEPTFLDYFNSNVNVCEIFTKDFITSGTTFNNILPNSPFYVYLPDINGFYRASRYNTKYLSTIPVNNGIYLEDVSTLLETDNNIISNFFNTRQKTNVVFTHGLNQSISLNSGLSSSNYLDQEELNFDNIPFTLSINIDTSIGAGTLTISSTVSSIPSTLFTVGDIYKLKGSILNNNLVIYITFKSTDYIYFFNVVEGTLQNETISVDTIFSKLTFSKLVTDITSDYSRGNILNVNYLHKNGMNVNAGSYFIEDTYFTTTDGYKFVIGENQYIKAISDKIYIPIYNTTTSANPRYNTTLQKNIELNINKEIYSVDNAYINNANLHISSQDLIFQTGNINIYGSNIFTLNSINNTITSNIKYHFTDLVPPCMIRLDNEYYLVKDNKYPFQTLELDDTTAISSTGPTSANIEIHTISSRLGLVDLGNMQQATEYRIFGGNNNHLNLITPISNSIAISNTSVFCTPSSNIINYKSNNKQLLVESNPNSINQYNPIATGYHDGYFKYFNENISNVDIIHDNRNTIYEPINYINYTDNIKGNKLFIVPDNNNSLKYNLINYYSSSNIISSYSNVDTFNGSNIFNEVTTLTNNFTLYGETFNTFKINTYGYLLFESAEHKHTVNFLLYNKFNFNYRPTINTAYLSSPGLTDNIYLIDFISTSNNSLAENNCQIRLYLNNSNNIDIGKIEIHNSNNLVNNIVVGLDSTINIDKENRNKYNTITDYSIIKTPIYNISNTLANFKNTKTIFTPQKGLPVIIQKITDDFGQASDNFGSYTAMYDNYLVVGSYLDDDKGTSGGSASIFKLSSNNIFYQIQKITDSYGGNNYNVGEAISIYKDYIVINSNTSDNRGAVVVFKLSSDGLFYQTQKLTDDYGSASNQFGLSLSIYGDYIVVGSPSDYSLAGSATIFKLSSDGLFYQLQKLTDHSGASPDSYGNINAVSIYDDYIVVGSYLDDDNGNNSGSAFVYKLSSNGLFYETQKITDHTGIANDRFGTSISMYNNYIAIGASSSNRDSVSIYKLSSNGLFNAIQKITSHDSSTDIEFGVSTGIYDHNLVIGSSNNNAGVLDGSVYVYELGVNGLFTEILKITEHGGSVGDYVGKHVSIYGDYICIPLIGDDEKASNAGSSLIYQLSKYNNNNLKISQKITDHNGAISNAFGSVVDIYDDYIISSSPFDGSETQGSVSILKISSDNLYYQVQKITQLSYPSSINFGESLSIYGNYIVVGSDNESSGKGAATIFKLSSDGLYYQTQKLTSHDGIANDRFGIDLVIYNEYIVIGAYGDDDNGSASGSAYVYKLSTDGIFYEIQKLTDDDGAAGDLFGLSLSMYGEYIVIGSSSDDDTQSGAGSSVIYKLSSNGLFYQVQKITDDFGAGNDNFGTTVSIYGKFIAIGSPNDDDTGSNSGSICIFKLSTDGVFYQTQKLTDHYGDVNDKLGNDTLSLYNDYLVAGVSQDGTAVGSVILYKLDENDVFNQIYKITDHNGQASDLFGISAAIYGENIVIGASGDDDNGTSSGTTFIFKIEDYNTNYLTYTENSYTLSNTVGFTTASNITLTSTDLIHNFNYLYKPFSNISLSNYGYVYFEDNIHQYYFNVLNISEPFDSMKYDITNNTLITVYENSSSNLTVEARFYLENSVKNGYIEVLYNCDNDIILPNNKIGTLGIDVHHLNSYNNANIDINNVSNKLLLFNDTSNISNIYSRLVDDIDNTTIFDSQINGILHITNTQNSNNLGLFQLTGYNSNVNNDNDYYINLKHQGYDDIEYNSNINILINQWVGNNISINNIRTMTGEHSDFIRFHKLRENIFNSEFDLVQQNYANVNILDKSLNFSVNTSQFNNSNITSTNILVLNEQVPSDLIHNYQRDTANIGLFKNVNKYALSLGTPFLASLSSDSNISLQQEITNINKEPIGFIDIYQECSNINNISNIEIFTYTALTDTHTANIYLDGTLNKISITDLTYNNVETLNNEIIDGNKILTKYQPFKKCQPGNIIKINYSNISTTFNKDYVISNISSDFKSVYIDSSYRTLPLGNTSIQTIDTNLSYFNIFTGITQSITNQGIKGHIISDRYNFANFTNISNIDTFALGNNIDFATGTYLSVIEAPILNYEQEQTTGFNSIYYNEAIIPGNSINYYSENNSTFDNSNIQITLDYGYKAEKMLTKSINLDTGDNILIIPSSNLTIQLETTDLQYINKNTTADTSNLTIYFNDNVIVSDNVATDFSKFEKGTIVSSPFFLEETIISNVYLELNTTIDNTSSNLYLTPNCSNTLATIFEFQSSITSNIITSGQLDTIFGSGTNMLFKQIGLYSSNIASTDLSIYKRKDEILVSGTPLNPTSTSNIGSYNNYMVDNSTYNFLYFNEYRLYTDNLTITTEQPLYLKVEKVVINNEDSYNRQDVPNVNINYISTSNSIITINNNELITPGVNGNFNNFTYEQDIVLLIGTSNIFYGTTNLLPTPNDLSISVSGLSMDYTNSNVKIFKNIKLTRIGSPLDLTVGNQTSIFHYQDAQGNNLMLGSFAGQFSGSKTQCIHNTYIGSKVGQTNHGSGNMFLGSETGLAINSSQGETYFNNKFAIYKNEFIGVKSNPLIGGDFTSGRVGINTINPDNLLSATLVSDTKLVVNGAVRASSHNTFTGTHIVSLSNSCKLSYIEPGMVLSSTGNVKKLGIIDTIVECELTKVKKDKKIYGIYVGYENNEYYINNVSNEKHYEQLHYVAGVGEGQIWVSNINGNIQAGDYVCSSDIPGYAMKQDDDLVHNYTIAKITEDIDWNINELFKNNNGLTTKIALLGCVYLCS